MSTITKVKKEMHGLKVVSKQTFIKCFKVFKHGNLEDNHRERRLVESGATILETTPEANYSLFIR